MNALETRVLELIGEDPDNPDVYVDTDVGIAPIRDSINEAIAEIIMLSGGFKRTYFLPLRSGTAFYRLRPRTGEVGWITDVWSVNPRYRLDQTDLVKLTNSNPRWMIASAPPVSYQPIGQDVIGVYPKPSSNSDVLEITLVEIPSAYTTDTDKINLRDQYQYAAVNYAVSDFWASRGDAGEAQKYMGLYMDAMGLGKLYDPQKDSRWQYQTQKEPWPVNQ